MKTPLPPRRTSRILLVDDEPKLVAALKRALHGHPFEIHTAASASEALLALERQSLDAVVSDQDMPGMSGVMLFAVIRKLYPATVRFMLTGKATLDLAIAAINEGAIQRFFTKPMDPAVLAASLKEALAQKALVEDAWRLVQRTREQRARLDSLERDHPGITRIECAEDGALLLEVPPQSLEELLDEISSTLHTGDGSHAR
jgi:DNA-binding NtrC family response regulator